MQGQNTIAHSQNAGQWLIDLTMQTQNATLEALFEEDNEHVSLLIH